MIPEIIDKWPVNQRNMGISIQQDNANPDNEDTKVKPGQRVFLDWSKSLPVNIDDKAAVIIDIEHIKAVINES